MNRGPESKSFEPINYIYPKEYFNAQIIVANKIKQLGLSPNIQSAILNYTVIYRHLVGKNPTKQGPSPEWVNFVKTLPEENFLTNHVWSMYTKKEHSIYKPKENQINSFGSFIYKTSINKKTKEQEIELHFNNQRRGQIKSDFSRKYVYERVADLTNLFQSIYDRKTKDPIFNPKKVILVSWMNNLPGVRESLPKLFIGSETTVKPPNLNFRSNSLWGQFLTNQGNIHIERLEKLLNNIKLAKNINEIVNSFPIQVKSFESDIEVFFSSYNIKI